MIRYYLSPIIQILPRNANGPKLHIYMDFAAGEAYSCVNPYPYKPWALVYVEASESTHAAIQADIDITLVPFWDSGGEYLPLTAQVLDVAEPYRSNIAAFMESHRIPTGWITGTMTLGRVVRYIIQILQIVQMLQDDYPELELDMTVKDIQATKRQRILQWMGAHGIETQDIALSWTIRQVLGRIIRDFGWQAILHLGTALL